MRRLSIAGLAVTLVALAACGSSSSSSTTTSSTPAAPPTRSSSTSTLASSTSAGGAVKLAADPSGALKYEQAALSAKAGTVSIAFTNSSPVGHNVTIASSSGAVLGATPTFRGGTRTVTLNLKPGIYTFYCSVPGHRQAGMHGTLVVK